jgi:hypothetical protein
MRVDIEVDKIGKFYLPKIARDKMGNMDLTGFVENGVVLIFPKNLKQEVLEGTVVLLLKERELDSQMKYLVA